MQKPKIVMNVAAWAKVSQNKYRSNLHFHEDESSFYIGDVPVLVVPAIEDQITQMPLEDPTGYSN